MRPHDTVQLFDIDLRGLSILLVAGSQGCYLCQRPESYSLGIMSMREVEVKAIPDVYRCPLFVWILSTRPRGISNSENIKNTKIIHKYKLTFAHFSIECIDTLSSELLRR